MLSRLSCATRSATCTLPGLGAAFMHRPAWKGNSPKVIFTILNSAGPSSQGSDSPSGAKHRRRHYELRWCIRLRCSESYVADEYLALAAQLLSPDILHAIWRAAEASAGRGNSF